MSYQKGPTSGFSGGLGPRMIWAGIRRALGIIPKIFKFKFFYLKKNMKIMESDGTRFVAHKWPQIIANLAKKILSNPILIYMSSKNCDKSWISKIGFQRLKLVSIIYLLRILFG